MQIIKKTYEINSSLILDYNWDNLLLNLYKNIKEVNKEYKYTLFLFDWFFSLIVKKDEKGTISIVESDYISSYLEINWKKFISIVDNSRVEQYLSKNNCKLNTIVVSLDKTDKAFKTVYTKAKSVRNISQNMIKLNINKNVVEVKINLNRLGYTEFSTEIFEEIISKYFS